MDIDDRNNENKILKTNFYLVLDLSQVQALQYYQQSEGWFLFYM
jgi:hypothetical protein